MSLCSISYQVSRLFLRYSQCRCVFRLIFYFLSSRRRKFQRSREINSDRAASHRVLWEVLCLWHGAITVKLPFELASPSRFQTSTRRSRLWPSSFQTALKTKYPVNLSTLTGSSLSEHTEAIGGFIVTLGCTQFLILPTLASLPCSGNCRTTRVSFHISDTQSYFSVDLVILLMVQGLIQLDAPVFHYKPKPERECLKLGIQSRIPTRLLLRDTAWRERGKCFTLFILSQSRSIV